MAKFASVIGLQKTLAQLKVANREKIAAYFRGYKKAGIFLQRLSMQIVPVDEGNLKASGSDFPRWTMEGDRITVICGYTAEYAVIVHEDLELRHGQVYNDWYRQDIDAGRDHERGPHQQAKFLEEPLRKNRNEIRQIIVDEINGDN